MPAEARTSRSPTWSRSWSANSQTCKGRWGASMRSFRASPSLWPTSSAITMPLEVQRIQLRRRVRRRNWILCTSRGIVIADDVGHKLGLALNDRILAPHRPLQVWEFADHERDQVGLREVRASAGIVDGCRLESEQVA